MMKYDYDVAFLGGGLNYAGAITASKSGLKSVLIEQNLEHLGGTCLHNGCIPSKMYLYSAKTLLASKTDYFSGELKLDMPKLEAKKEAMLNKASKSIAKQCDGVDLISGKGVVTAPHTIQVDDKTITAKHIIIGTGAKPFIPDGIEYDAKDIITSDDVLQLKTLPKSIAVYGDGAIGLEMATFFASAGVKTTLISRHSSLLRKAHPTISKNIALQIDSIGISFLTDKEITSAKPSDKGVHITFTDNSSEVVEKLLVAIGRKPNTDIIQTKEIEVEPKGIKTDIHFETTLANHYAVGDCNGKVQLAHSARAQVLYVVKKILGKQVEVVDMESIVKFIHTLPCSYAQVGKSFASLQDDTNYKESVVMLKGMPFASSHDASFGVMVVYADAQDFIVGAEIFAPNAEELISAVAMAIAGEMDAKTAQRTILAHPTFSESLEKAFYKL